MTGPNPLDLTAAPWETIPYRLALAGGWIDQPFVSAKNPQPPGSMVVVQIKPTFRFMERCGMATSTRRAAARLWNGTLPPGKPDDLVRSLYAFENQGREEPSGSQDMAGLIYPGINRLDYDASWEGGIFPVNVESCRDTATAGWLERVLYLLPVCQRPDGYSPLGVKNLDPVWIEKLSESGKDCYASICRHDLEGLGQSMNDCMTCWEALLPHTVSHPTLNVDLKAILHWYQDRYAGAMYSGCGGGYLVVASGQPVPGAFQFTINLCGAC